MDYCLFSNVQPENSFRDYVKDNKIYRGILLHYMTAALHMIYSKSKDAKDIWDTLQAKYGTEDFGTKKYACSRWLKFSITDDKPVLDHVHEYKHLCADFVVEGMAFLIFSKPIFYLKNYLPIGKILFIS